MDIQHYGNYTVALNDAKVAASGTQDDDYAVVNRKVNLKGSTFNFEVNQSSNRDFGVGLVQLKKRENDGQTTCE